MRLGNWLAYAAGVTVFVLGAVSNAQAQNVTFWNINDAVPSRFFDADASYQVPNSNKLIIGFNTGFDYTTWKYKDFRASTAAFSHTTVVDTIDFRVAAPKGHYITKITYRQWGTGATVRTGKAAGAANWVVDGYAADIGVFGTNPSASATADLAEMYLSSVAVSITNALFAYATPSLGSATTALSGAEVLVEIAPWPWIEEVSAPTDPTVPTSPADPATP
jgi:hypothetical protein